MLKLTYRLNGRQDSAFREISCLHPPTKPTSKVRGKYLLHSFILDILPHSLIFLGRKFRMQDHSKSGIRIFRTMKHGRSANSFTINYYEKSLASGTVTSWYCQARNCKVCDIQFPHITTDTPENTPTSN